jgi:DNA-binding CsgD family transcriptional regulator
MTMAADDRHQTRQDAIKRLSAGQKACLSLVLTRRNSKEIAQELGVSSHTVDQRLRIAMQTLGVASRFEAARLVFEAEEPEGYQRQVYQEPYIGSDATEQAFTPASSQEASSEQNDHGAERTKADQAGETPNSYSLPLPLSVRRGTRNDLTPMSRLTWVFALLIGLALAVGIFIIAAEALARIYSRTSL